MSFAKSVIILQTTRKLLNNSTFMMAETYFKSSKTNDFKNRQTKKATLNEWTPINHKKIKMQKPN